MIVVHEHQWVPWDEHRLTVCDGDDGCTAAIDWDHPTDRPGTGTMTILDWKEVLAGRSVTDVRVQPADEGAAMSSALKCRADGPTPADDPCGLPAAVGLVSEAVPDHIHDGLGEHLELIPLCEVHAPEIIHEVSISMNVDEWAVITLAYGASGGDLR